MILEIFIGRCAAFCIHPAIAWRRLPTLGRLCLVSAYFAGSYLATLALLLIV